MKADIDSRAERLGKAEEVERRREGIDRGESGSKTDALRGQIQEAEERLRREKKFQLWSLLQTVRPSEAFPEFSIHEAFELRKLSEDALSYTVIDA